MQSLSTPQHLPHRLTHQSPYLVGSPVLTVLASSCPLSPVALPVPPPLVQTFSNLPPEKTRVLVTLSYCNKSVSQSCPRVSVSSVLPLLSQETVSSF